VHGILIRLLWPGRVLRQGTANAWTRSLERRRRRKMLSNTISFLRDHLFTMPVLAKFAVGW